MNTLQVGQKVVKYHFYQTPANARRPAQNVLYAAHPIGWCNEQYFQDMVARALIALGRKSGAIVVAFLNKGFTARSAALPRNNLLEIVQYAMSLANFAQLYNDGLEIHWQEVECPRPALAVVPPTPPCMTTYLYQPPPENTLSRLFRAA